MQTVLADLIGLCGQLTIETEKLNKFGRNSIASPAHQRGSTAPILVKCLFLDLRIKSFSASRFGL